MASFCGIGFNMLQPRPLIAPACWGVFFICCHVFQISILWRERRHISLSEDEELAYESAFLRYGFTPRQFIDVINSCQVRFKSFSTDATIHRKGDDMETIDCLLEGEVQIISTTGDPMGKTKPGKGGWLGEFFDPNMDPTYWDKPHNYRISYNCISEGGCRT